MQVTITYQAQVSPADVSCAVRVAQAAGGLPVLSLATADGWRCLDGRHDPVADLSSLLPPARRAPSVALVLGCGSGYLPAELLARGYTRQLVVTADRSCAQQTASLLGALHSAAAEVRILVAGHADAALLDAVSRFRRTFDAVPVAHARECAAFSQLFDPLRTLCAEPEHLPRPRPAAVPRVAMSHSGSLLEPDIAAVFAQQGCEVRRLPDLCDAVCDPAGVWRMLCDHRPACVFSLNSRGSDARGLLPTACARAGIAWITWFLDDPTFIVSPRALAPVQRRVAYCWDAAGIAACNRLGIADARLLPLATNHRQFFPGTGDPGLDGRVVYVGSPSFGGERRYFAAMMGDAQACAHADRMHDWIVRYRRVPTPAIVRQVVGSAVGTSRRQRERLAAFALFRANIRYRIAALQALAPLRPVVFGDGWQGLLPPGIELRPAVDYYRQLPGIYRADAVHVSLTHLQMSHFPNQRLFDVGACGRAVLTEGLDGVGELVPDCASQVSYHSFEELAARAADLCRAPHERHQIGASLHRQVLARHTLDHRIGRIIADLRDSADARDCAG